MHFMLQNEVVERMVAAPRRAAYGRLSVMLQSRFTMELLFIVADGRLPAAAESRFGHRAPGAACRRPLRSTKICCAVAFSARRKQLRNALRGVDFARAGIDPTLRPENLLAARRTLRSGSLRLDELDLVAVGILDERDHRVPPFTGPASRVTLPPPVRTRSQACFTSDTPMAMWPKALPSS